MSKAVKVKAIERIPKGIYCYERLEKIENSSNLRVVNICPFYSYNEYLGLYRCDFLNLYGVPNDSNSPITYEDRVEYFGSEEEFFKQSPLDLLFDSVKECGENIFFDD